MASTFWQERLTKTGEIIVTYEDAILALTAGTIQSYQLDTGQSSQRVTKFNIEVLEGALDSLYNRYATLEARCNGTALIVVPGF